MLAASENFKEVEDDASEILVLAREVLLLQTEILLAGVPHVVKSVLVLIINNKTTKMELNANDRARQVITAAAFAAKYRSKREV